MAKSVTTDKRENEKKKLARRAEKQKRKEEKKLAPKVNSLDDMIAYVDENGMITSTPPEESVKREEIKQEDIMKSEYPWENRKIGGSVPPIKTPEGWLFIYHGVADDREPFCYRAGAALLDLENPSKVIARLPYPILEPEEGYEVKGDMDNVVFPVGAYIHDGYLYMSYGGADKVVALCRFSYDELLKELKKNPCK